MNGKDLLLGMSFISESYVQEADTQPLRKGTALRMLLPMAACLCILLGMAVLGQTLLFQATDSANESAQFLENTASGGAMANGTGAPETVANAAIIWNPADSVQPQESPVPADGSLYTYGSNLERFAFFGGSFLPDTLLERFKLEDTAGLPFRYSDTEGQQIQVLAEKADSILFPMGEFTTGNARYSPESYSVTMVEGSAVQFFQADDSTQIARLLLPSSEGSYLLLTISSESLSDAEWLRTLTQLIAFQEVTE